MAYGQIKYGSRGDDVSELQKKLNENGYNLTVDGDFGSETQKAVQDYQRKNGLTVDGIVGKNTWGKLTGGSPAEPKQSRYDAIMAKIEAAEQERPEYTGTYDDDLNALYEKIMGREKFTYDPNRDSMYHQYRDLYVQQGQQAMADTMGQAAGLTGGYSSSYGQNVGQQAYNAYLQKLNEIVPDLYGAAAEQYAREGEALYDQYAMLGDLRDQEYGRHQDELDQYWQKLGWLADQADTAYQQERDKIADEQWEREFAEAQRQYNESLAARYSGGSGGGYEENQQESKQATSEIAFSDTPMESNSYHQLGMDINSTIGKRGVEAAIDLLEKNMGKLTAQQFNVLADRLEMWAQMKKPGGMTV